MTRTVARSTTFAGALRDWIQTLHLTTSRFLPEGFELPQASSRQWAHARRLRAGSRRLKSRSSGTCDLPASKALHPEGAEGLQGAQKLQMHISQGVKRKRSMDLSGVLTASVPACRDQVHTLFWRMRWTRFAASAVVDACYQLLLGLVACPGPRCWVDSLCVWLECEDSASIPDLMLPTGQTMHKSWYQPKALSPEAYQVSRLPLPRRLEGPSDQTGPVMLFR